MKRVEAPSFTNQKTQSDAVPFVVYHTMVSLRGPSSKHFWDGLESLGERLEELGIGS